MVDDGVGSGDPTKPLPEVPGESAQGAPTEAALNAPTEPIAPHVPIADGTTEVPVAVPPGLGATAPMIATDEVAGVAPVGAKRPVLPWVISAIAAALVIVFAALVIPRLLDNESPVPAPVTSSNTQAPSVNPSAAPSEEESEESTQTPTVPPPGGGTTPAPTTPPATSPQPTETVPVPTPSATP